MRAQSLLTHVKRICDNEKGRKGTYTHDPAEIDHIARQLWDKAYDDKPLNHSVRVADFYCKFKSPYKHQAQMKFPPLTIEHIKQACQTSKHAAIGLDHFEPENFSRFSDQAYLHLAIMFNTIEKGAQWPKESCKARTVLSKLMGNNEDPMSYRCLTIPSVPYRKWATTRLDTLEPWKQTWDSSDICAGGIGKGAQDGWYRTAAILESWSINGIDYSGGAIDIITCSDKIPDQSYMPWRKRLACQRRY